MRLTKPVRVLVVCICLTHFHAFGATHALTLRIGDEPLRLVSVGDTWSYLRGTHPPSDPGLAWTQAAFDDKAWERGLSGFGYGDRDDATELLDMRNRYVSLYIRTSFTVSALEPDEIVELTIDYDDGFIAYLNGQEVARRHMPDGPVTNGTRADSHEAGTAETIRLGGAQDLLQVGRNVLAIEGHNSSLTSSDFSLKPALRLSSDSVRSGQSWVTERDTVVVNGWIEIAEPVSLMLDESPLDFNETDGTWSHEVVLRPGLNSVRARVWADDANLVDANSIDIVYLPPDNHLSGALTEDTTLTGAWRLDEILSVPKDVTLSISPGTWIMMTEGSGLMIAGRLVAAGEEGDPIVFTHYGRGSTWKQILFSETADSTLSHCVFEYADSVGAHQDYYEPGPRNYHEAIVLLASHVTFKDCLFRHLPDDSGRGEGDAIAVIADDADVPGSASARIEGCQFLRIGQGVHTRYAYVLIEDCYFTGKNGDNDDVDLYGESDPPPLIVHNRFIDPAHDDMINPTRCSALIVGNIIAGSDDHGIVLRDTCTPLVMNNLIVDCRNAGIAVENTCDALLVNNTIVNCGRGIRLLDLGRWGPPYRLQPGGGMATVINGIIWDCDRPITLADSPNTALADRGSHITVRYTDIQGGRQGISSSGVHSTVTWGLGNIDRDPFFVDAAKGNYRLQSRSPVIDAGSLEAAPDHDLEGSLRPCGGGIDMGAFEAGDCLQDPNDTNSLLRLN